MSIINCKFYKKNDTFTLDVNFLLQAQGITLISGTSGSGKTTFLRCIAGITDITYGALWFNTSCWFNSNSNIYVEPNFREIGYSPQEIHLFPHLNVVNNLLFGFKRTPINKRNITVEAIIEKFKLKKLLSKSIVNLSGGEKQRISIGRAILTNPRLLLLDEPISALDSATKKYVIKAIVDISTAFNIPVLFVSHERSEIYPYVQQELKITNGKVYVK